MTRCWFAFLATVLAALGGCSKPVAVRPVAEVTAPAEPITHVSIETAPGDWPWWGGPHRNGIAAAGGVPVEWSGDKNVVWKAAVPGRGHSSPILIGNRVILTTADKDAQQQIALCYDRRTGTELWRRTIHEGGLMKMHSKNSHASATPASDGEHVYVVFINSGALRVTSLDLDGNIVWQRKAGPFESEHGYGSSPVLYGSLLITNGDNMTGCFVAALDRETGDVKWRTVRETSGRHGSYATPTVVDLAGKPQLILTGMSGVCSYDPATGKLIWTCRGPAEVTASCVACSDRLVFASGGYPEKEILAIRADGSGDVTDTHVVWRESTGVAYVPTPVYHDGRLYMVSDGGVATCFDAEDGRQHWRGRLNGNFSASPILADGRFYVTNEDGRTYVLRDGDKLDIVAENQMSSGGFASPVICGRHIFLRTRDELYCFGEESPPASARR